MKRPIFVAGLLLLTSLATASPTITEHTTYYKISGDTPAELRTQMNTLGPSDHATRVDAKTSWYITWHYNWHYDTPSHNPCYVTNVQVRGNITYLLPEWINQDQGNSALQTNWNNYLRNLTNHEQGHANNGKQAAIEIEKALLNVPPQDNCMVLENRLNAAAKKVIEEHNAWDVQYDADTSHGKKQGAIFP